MSQCNIIPKFLLLMVTITANLSCHFRTDNVVLPLEKLTYNGGFSSELQPHELH